MAQSVESTINIIKDVGSILAIVSESLLIFHVLFSFFCLPALAVREKVLAGLGSRCPSSFKGPFKFRTWSPLDPQRWLGRTAKQNRDADR